MQIRFSTAKKKLALVWFIFAGIIFLLFFLQTVMGKFENKITEAWGWLFPTILPTLSLILTVFVADLKSPPNEIYKVDRFYFLLALFLSVFYLLIIISILLIQPLINKPIIALMKESSIYLGPFQGIISGAMGLFFLKKEEGKK